MAKSSSTGHVYLSRTQKSKTQKNRTQKSSSQTKRYYKRYRGPRNWWPAGIIPVLLLTMLYLWGLFRIAPAMQTATQDSVVNTLRTAGYENLQVSANGQEVQIKGVSLDADVERVKSIARGATCNTLLAGDLVCPTRVDTDLGVSEAQRHVNFSFLKSKEGIVLRGGAPDAVTHDQVLAAARARFDVVIDSLHVMGHEVDERYNWAMTTAWAFLSEINTGKITWMDGVLSAMGRTVKEQEQQLRNLFSSTQYPDRIGALTLQFEHQVAACNQQFAEVLGNTSILFNTGSAVISEESRQKLAAISAVAGNCPGELVIAGHTDNLGQIDENLNLSRQRAQAVADALEQVGIQHGRLRAVGYGEARPIATNETPSGRAMNRRIEIKVADFN